MSQDFGFPSTNEPGYYFVSYNNDDAARIAPIARALHLQAVPLWYDRDLIYGDKWETQIAEKIQLAKAVIMFFTRGILHKEDSFVKKEHRIATRHYNKKVCVVMLDQIDPSEIPTSMVSWWTEIQANHYVIAADTAGATAERILQAISADSTEAAAHPAAEPDGALLPGSISLFELLGVRNIGDFDIEAHWRAADVTTSLAVPVGVALDGSVVTLDLHQRKDGPNGIIAGPAASGKSEFLSTLLLSLALHFPPSQVQFVINDYMHTLQDLKLLPHTGYYLDDASPVAFNVLHSHLQREMARRDALLAQYNAQNIYQYLKLAATDTAMPSMPHIVISVDPLGMLKRDYPEEFFLLRQLSSIENARKYGFHVIWATQSPEGLVDDSLEQLTNIKLFISARQPNKAPGRFYLQTQSHDAVRLLQLAYSGVSAVDIDSLNDDTQWFFRRPTQRQSAIMAIHRSCMD